MAVELSFYYGLFGADFTLMLVLSLQSSTLTNRPAKPVGRFDSLGFSTSASSGEREISIESLIPFGLHQRSAELVDVSAVPRGRQCGCVCPSCSTPLIARQGQKKEWHFAHQSRAVHDETQRECEYSFFVSARLMFRQLSASGLAFRTPGLIGHLDSYSKVSRQRHRIEFKVTDATLIDLDSVQVGSTFSGTEVDVVGRVGDVPFVVYCTYDGRAVPESLFSPTPPMCGVVEFNLVGLARRFRSVRNGRYMEALRAYIENSTEGKSWIHHPRYERAGKQAEADMALWLANQQPSPSIRHRATSHASDFSASQPVPTRTRKHFRCVICGNTWYSLSRECHACETTLFTTEQ